MTKRRNPVKHPQIGENLRRIRLQKRLSIRVFCQKVEPPISPVQLLATEMQKRDPTVDMLLRYSRALGVSVDKLVQPQ